MMLTTEVLPEPDLPNSEVRPGPALNATSSSNLPRRCRIATSSTSRAREAAADAAGEKLGEEQRRHRDDDGDDGESQGAGIAARHLREGVDRRGQGLRLARDVRDEGDRRAE